MAQKQRKQLSLRNGDPICNLPDDVINSILVRMPIKDAVRTSILSKNWRYRWASISKLEFIVYEEKDLMKNVAIMDQVLLLHVGPIHTFIYRSFVSSGDYINRWILFLSRNGVKEFIFEVSEFDIPSTLFFCEELNYLELTNCSLEVPATIKGFINLTNLNLRDVYISDDALTFLISKCPLLERLKLLEFDMLLLDIYAPKLHHLIFSGMFHDFCPRKFPCLSVVSIYLVSLPDGMAMEGSNLEEFLACWPRIERLTVKSRFSQYLSGGIIPKKLSWTCDHLKYLSMHINFSVDFLAVLCICRSSPNLHKIKLKWTDFDDNKGNGAEDAGFGVDQEQEDCLFSHLQVVEMVDISFRSWELKFIGHVLINSPILETISITTYNCRTSKEVEIFKELMQFRRASALARIICLKSRRKF